MSEGDIRRLEEKIDELNSKMIPLLDLLQSVIKVNIPNNSEPIIKKDLCYKVDLDKNLILIYGSKTYDSKETLKSNFSDATWQKSLGSWTIPFSVENEEKLKGVFLEIFKDQ